MDAPKTLVDTEAARSTRKTISNMSPMQNTACMDAVVAPTCMQCRVNFMWWHASAPRLSASSAFSSWFDVNLLHLVEQISGRFIRIRIWSSVVCLVFVVRRSCQFSGSIPKELGALRAMQTLFLGFDGLTGKVWSIEVLSKYDFGQSKCCTNVICRLHTRYVVAPRLFRPGTVLMPWRRKRRCFPSSRT